MTQSTLADLIETFALLGDWEERYRYLIDLGRTLEPMDEALKTEETLVRGCTSRVWMVAQTTDGRVHFLVDSDAHIVRGLIAILMAAYQDRTPEEIKAVDIHEAFGRLGLEQHLSPNRRNGFFAMVERIGQIAG